MTKTLEEIKGMNLSVGTPIELTINSSVHIDGRKGKDNKISKEMGYFKRFIKRTDTEGNDVSNLIYDKTNGGYTDDESSYLICLIEEIRILQYS